MDQGFALPGPGLVGCCSSVLRQWGTALARELGYEGFLEFLQAFILLNLQAGISMLAHLIDESTDLSQIKVSFGGVFSWAVALALLLAKGERLRKGPFS